MRSHLAAHEHNEDASADVGVHALLLCQLEQCVLAGGIWCWSCSLRVRSTLLTLDKRVATPGCADEPPFALRFSRTQVRKRHAEGFVRHDC